MQTRTVGARGAAAGLIAAPGIQSAEFPHALANHLPMLLAIFGSPRRIAPAPRACARRYDADNAVPPLAQAGAPMTRQDWRRDLGRCDREGAYRVFFAGQVDRLGSHEAIRLYVPDFAQGSPMA